MAVLFSMMRISVVTPSYKQPDWLRLCAASVADQSGPNFEVEHIVQDSLSGPAIAEVLAPFPNVKLVSEKDEGMYDAIDRGWKKATGDVVSWLNCDEQFLPGALQLVAEYFEKHPDVDVLFADTIVIDADCNYICDRQVLVPMLYHTWVCSLMTLSSSTFFRKKVISNPALSLDTNWKDLGDSELIIRLIRANVKMGYLREYLSTFVDSGDNRNLKALARQEHKHLAAQAPGFVQAVPWLWIGIHRLRRWAHGLYSVKPHTYKVFTAKSPDQRVSFVVSQPTYYWKSRMDLPAS